MVEQKHEVRKIPVRKVSPQELRAQLETKIRKFEWRYERPSEEMLQLLSVGAVKETSEILEWIQAYHGLQYLNKETPTTGTPSTTTEPSTKSG